MASQLKPDLPWNTTEAYLFVMAAIADNLEPYVYTVNLWNMWSSYSNN